MPRTARESASPSGRPSPAAAARRRLPEIPLAVQVVALLVPAFLADFFSGPAITSASFYIFPVALAGWRGGVRSGVGTGLIAVALDVTADTIHPGILPPLTLRINEALRLIVFVTVGLLGARLGGQQRAVREQRDRLATLNAQMEESIATARRLQELLGGPLPVHPAVEIGTYLLPARILGGDMIDLTLGPRDHLSLALVDVSGKGVPAALAGAAMLGLLEDAPARFRSPAETLRYLNSRLHGMLPPDMFVTIFNAVLDLGDGTLRYASAGHERAVLARASGELRELRARGIVLGAFPDAEFSEETMTLRPGDLLFCYTDGITDLPLPGGQRLGVERLIELVARRQRLPGEDLVAQVAAAATGQAAAPPQDDITLLALRYRGGVHPG